MKRLWLMLIASSLLQAEPSVYASASRAPTRSSLYALKQEVARLHEEVDGLRSIVEGLSRTVERLKPSRNGGEQKLLRDISTLLDTINQKYVSHSELKRAITSGRVTTPIRAAAPKPKQRAVSRASTTPKGSLATAPSSALYSRGVRLVTKKHYSDALKRFEILEQRGYKKAPTHFYLGEIAYRTHQYARAIDEYKQSAELNDHAGYMDTLLLHTGLAMEKDGKKRQAKRFFQAIIDGYPKTSSARIAKKHL